MAKKISLTETQFGRFGLNITFDNPLTMDMYLLNEGKLREGLIRTYPVDKVCGYISDYLGIPEKSVMKNDKNGIETIIINIPTGDKSLESETIKVMTNLCRYLLSLKQTRHDGKEMRLHFEPKFEDDVTKMVNNEKFLVHASPHFNRDKILKMGFLPKTKNTFFNYPERVYFFLGSNGIDNIINVVKNINNVKSSEYINGTYDLYLIDVSKIPVKVRFYVDPNANGCVFTTDVIPSSAILRIRRQKIT